MSNTAKIRGVDNQGDWLFGFGLSSYKYFQDEIVQDVETRLQCFLNDCFWNLGFGVDWWNLIGGKNPAAEQNIILQCRTLIIGAFGVVAINSVDAVMNANTRRLSVTYDINTIFSQAVKGTVTPAQ